MPDAQGDLVDARPKMVAPGDGVLAAPGGPASPRIEIKHASEPETGFSVVEYHVPPNWSPPPTLHRQTREDVAVYIAEGELTYWFGDGQERRASTGTLVWLPRGSWNRWANTSGAPVRMLALFGPAGFERYFVELGALMTEAAGDPARVRKAIGPLRARYGDEEQ